MPTRLLTREDIAQTMTLGDYIQAVELAFAQATAAGVHVPPVVHIPRPKGAVHVKSAGFTEAPGYVAVKVNANFPANPTNHGLPTIQGAIVLCDGNHGSLLAVMDSAEVTAQRTAAATAVAARYLARPDTRVATLIGCGVQGPLQALALREVLPIDTLYLFDIDPGRAQAMASWLQPQADWRIEVVDDFAEATRRGGAIVTCTSSRQPFLGSRHVPPGSFIAAVGADNDDKQELETDLLTQSKLVVDVLDQCALIGELHHALDAGHLTRDDIFAQLGTLVAGGRPAVLEPDDIVIFDSTGTASQDVAAAGMIYERATAAGLGLEIDLS